MRVLSYDECEMVAGGNRWAGFFRWLKDVAAGIVAGLTVEQMQADDVEEQPEGPGVGWDPSTASGSGPAWGETSDGFRSGWVWSDENGVNWYDMDGDGRPESRTYISPDGTTWSDNMDGDWRAVSYP